MILTELIETSNLPRLFGSRTLQRELKTAKKKLQKLAKTQMRRTRSKTLAAIRRQYFITDAYADMRVSVRRNEDIFIVGLLAIFILIFSSLNTAMNFMLLFLGTAYEVADFTGINMGFLMLLVMGSIAALFGWIICFVLNMLSLATMDGATRRIKSARATARTSLALASRVTAAWFLLIAILCAPLALAGITSMTLLRADILNLVELLEYSPYVVTGAISWIVFVLMNYSLVPHVALFEKIDLRNAFGRSRKLVQRRGRMFVLLAHCMLGITLFAGFQLSLLLDYVLHIEKWLSFPIIAFTSVIIANCIMVVFYRKRRLARTN